MFLHSTSHPNTTLPMATPVTLILTLALTLTVNLTENDAPPRGPFSPPSVDWHGCQRAARHRPPRRIGSRGYMALPLPLPS